MEMAGRGLYGSRGFENSSRAAQAPTTGTRVKPIAFSVLLLLGVVLSYCVVEAEPFGELDPSTDDWIVSSRAGVPPEIWSDPIDPYPVTSGEASNFTFWIRDLDSSSLNVTWDWGDGIVETANMSIVPASNTKVSRSHTYDPIPEPGRSYYNVTYVLNFTIVDPDLNSDYDLTVVDCMVNVFNMEPTNLTLDMNSTIVDPSDEVYIMASAVDAEGEALTWTFKFTDDESQVYRIVCFHTPTSAPGQRVWSNLTHVFGTVGTHRVYVNVSDALPPHQVFPHNISTNMHVHVLVNSAPEVGYSIGVSPTDPFIYESLGYVLVSYYIECLDFDGDVMTATWDFDDGSPVATNTSGGGVGTYQFCQTHNYTDSGDFNVSVNITDGREGHDVLRYVIVHIGSDNLPPSAEGWSASNDFGGLLFVGETLTVTVVFTDPEQDTIYTCWDFGDGSPRVYANSSDYDDGNVALMVEHVYLSPGTYVALVCYTDGEEGVLEHDKEFTIGFSVYLDTEDPVADAGPDGLAQVGLEYVLNGSDSHDNAGIVNYTWSFVHNGTAVELYGPSPTFTFWSEGSYVITLTVLDGAGHSSTDEVEVTVMTEIPEFSGFWAVILGVAALLGLFSAHRRR